MNKKSFIYLAASLLVFVSCKGKLDDISGDVFDYPLEMTFYASNEAHARTLLNDESILWESSDRIKVLWGENQYNVAASKPYNSGLNAEFTTTVDPASAYFGVYPHSAVSSLSDCILDVKVPKTQTGLFSDANIAVSKADEQNNMFFRHVVSWLEFTIDRTGVLTFSSRTGAPLTGTVSIKEFGADGDLMYDVVGESSVVTLDIKSSGTYYIALLPDVKLEGLSFTLIEDVRQEYASSPNNVQMVPGKLVALGNITERFGKKNDFGSSLEQLIEDDVLFDW